MSVYWLLFMFPLLGILMPGRLAPDLRRVVMLAVGAFAAMVIGLRYQIGVDWDQYVAIYALSSETHLASAMTIIDPAYGALNWLSAQFGWGVYGTNLVCGAFFAIGLTAFALRQPMPWLAWVVATPYLLIVVAMNYSRQGVALGFVFWGLAYLQEKRIWRFLVLVTLGAMFHQSAAILLPLAFFAKRNKNLLHIALLVLTMAVAASVFIVARFEYLWSNYVENPMSSQGAEVRVLMNALPAAVMLLTARRWNRLWPDPGHWRWIAWGALGCLLTVGLASTATDRIALYLAPVQVYVWSHFPVMFRDRTNRSMVTVGICVVYAAVLWVWLNYAIHAGWWLPYRTILLPD